MTISEVKAYAKMQIRLKTDGPEILDIKHGGGNRSNHKIELSWNFPFFGGRGGKIPFHKFVLLTK